ncbi:ferredoxin reductase [Mycobacterium sp.]|uniref:ferredoxin reductase n=1 Tax=Mycobacterium sp. TaxID=1785 RepID=UPI003A85B0DA
MSSTHAPLAADVIDTRRPKVAGADKHRMSHLLRRLATGITTPLLPDDYLQLANPLWSARELRGRILQVRRETEDSATLVIKPGWGFGFDYRPGQYVGIGLRVEGRWRWRSYSLTSIPVTGRSGSERRTIAITVKAMPDGFLSTHLVAGVEPGTVVRLAAPQGNFVLPNPAPSSILFLTAGSGITPVMSMLRTLARSNQIGDIVHLHSAPVESAVMFGAELAALACAEPGYRLSVRETRTRGRLDLSRLGSEVPDWRARQTWACGPEGMLNQAEKVWSAAGVGDRLHLERFAVSRATAAGDGSGGAGGSGGTVTFARSARSVEADAATSLMEAGEGAGVRMPFGCRMGICQSCVVELLEGHVRDLRTGREHDPGSRVQTCVSVASGDCAVDV